MVVGREVKSEACIAQGVEVGLGGIEARVAAVRTGADGCLEVDHGKVGHAEPGLDFGETLGIVPCAAGTARCIELGGVLHGIAHEYEFGFLETEQQTEKRKKREESHSAQRLWRRRRRSKAVTVLWSRDAMVMGPTPPGTGVM